jgi:hypothetical protein
MNMPQVLTRDLQGQIGNHCLCERLSGDLAKVRA